MCISKANFVHVRIQKWRYMCDNNAKIFSINNKVPTQ